MSGFICLWSQATFYFHLQKIPQFSGKSSKQCCTSIALWSLDYGGKRQRTLRNSDNLVVLNDALKLIFNEIKRQFS
eukprot:m.42325 g.42325  ORF g.42325 m.42325 type:complete len:76 (-) comp9871_c0_seq1:3348-3575(-)